MTAAAMNGFFDSPDRQRQRAIAVLIVALAVRLVALAQFWDVLTPRGDEAFYVQSAMSIASGDGYPGSVRPPLYSAFAGGVLAVFGDFAAVRFAQIALSLFTTFAIFQISSNRFGPRAGFASGLGCAIAPGMVHYTHFLWSEVLTQAILAAAFWALDRYDRRAELSMLAVAGVGLGLAALTREIWLYFAMVAVGWVFLGARRRAVSVAVPVAILTVALAATVLPWTLRNYALHGKHVTISTNRWFPIAMGNIYPEDGWYIGTERDWKWGFQISSREMNDLRRAAPGIDKEFAAQTFWKKVAIERIGSDQPWWIFKKTLRNFARLFYANSQELRFVLNGWVETSRAGAYLLIATDLVGSLLTMIPGILGLWLVSGDRLRTLAVLAILITLGTHIIANANPRFHVVIVPLVCLYAGPVLAGLRGLPRVPPWRWVGALTSVIAYVLVPLPLTVMFLRALIRMLEGLPRG